MTSKPIPSPGITAIRVIDSSQKKSSAHEKGHGRGKALTKWPGMSLAFLPPIRACRVLKRERVHQPAGHNRQDDKRTEKNQKVPDSLPGVALCDVGQDQGGQNAENTHQYKMVFHRFLPSAIS